MNSIDLYRKVKNPIVSVCNKIPDTVKLSGLGAGMGASLDLLHHSYYIQGIKLGEPSVELYLLPIICLAVMVPLLGHLISWDIERMTHNKIKQYARRE